MDGTFTRSAVYTDNSSHVIEIFNQKVADVLIPNTVLLLIGTILAIIGNIVVMHIHWRKLNSSQNFRMFIPYLALSDLITCVVCGALSVWNNFTWFPLIDKYVCRLWWFVAKLFQTTSLAFLMTIAFQRYIRICRPFKGEISKRIKFVFALCLLVFVIFHSVPFLIIADLKHSNGTWLNQNFSFNECRRYGSNSILSNIYRISENTFSAMFVLLLISFYLKSGLKLSKVGKRVNLSKCTHVKDNAVEFTIDPDESSVTIGRSLFYRYPASSNGNLTESGPSTSTTVNYGTNGRAYRKLKARNRKYQKINCMFLVISLIAIIAFIPRVAIAFFEVDDEQFWYPTRMSTNLDDEMLLFRVSMSRLYFTSYVINPLVYSIMDIEFRKHLKLCFCICRLENAPI